MNYRRIAALSLSTLLPLGTFAACSGSATTLQITTPVDKFAQSEEELYNYFNDQTGTDLNTQLCAFAQKINEKLQLKDNYVYSPLSLWLALSLFQGGTSGETAAKLDNLLHDSSVTAVSLQTKLQEQKLPAVEWSKIVGAFLHCLKNGESDLQINNLIAKTANSQWDEDFLKYADYYQANLATVDLNDAAQATKELNDWIYQHTANLIPNFFSDPLQDIQTLLINTIAFDGSWAHPFKSENTVKADFHINENETVKVDLMTMDSEQGQETVKFAYAEDEVGQYLSLPYQSDERMDLVLPKATYTPAQALAHYKEVYRDLVFDERKGVIKILKFSTETELSFKNVLKDLGLGTLFTENPDINKLLKNELLMVSNVLQKSKIEVNEVGTKAASATTILNKATSMLPPAELPPIEFVCDRPFAYIVTACGIPFIEGVQMRPAPAA